MALTLTEHVSSRRWHGGSVTFNYILTGTSDDATARTLLLASIPTSYGLLKRDEENIVIEPDWVDTTTASGQWRCEVNFVPVPPAATPEPGDPPQFSFDTTGGTQHISQSRKTVAVHVAGGTPAPIFGPVGTPGGGGIGFDGQDFQGVDIVAPMYAWSETHIVDDATVTNAYKGVLFSLTGTVNNATFKGFAAGECLFMGAAGSKRRPDDWEIAFKFASSPNATGLSVGDITEIDKKGWEYMWVFYEQSDDGAAKKLVKKPKAVYIEEVYLYGNHSLLGIGT